MASIMQRKSQLTPFDQLRDQFDHLLKNFFENGEGLETGLMEMNWRPRMDVAETDEAYQITVDLPGVDPDSVDISVTENQLTIQGERKEEKETKEKTFHRVERSYGSFFRSLTLPPGCDPTKIDAASDNGVVHISIPKAEEKKAKTIKVKPK